MSDKIRFLCVYQSVGDCCVGCSNSFYANMLVALSSDQKSRVKEYCWISVGDSRIILVGIDDAMHVSSND